MRDKRTPTDVCGEATSYVHVVNTGPEKRETLSRVFMEKTCSGKEDHPLSRVILRERLYEKKVDEKKVDEFFWS